MAPVFTWGREKAINLCLSPEVKAERGPNKATGQKPPPMILTTRWEKYIDAKESDRINNWGEMLAIEADMKKLIEDAKKDPLYGLED